MRSYSALFFGLGCATVLHTSHRYYIINLINQLARACLSHRSTTKNCTRRTAKDMSFYSIWWATSPKLVGKKPRKNGQVQQVVDYYDSEFTKSVEKIFKYTQIWKPKTQQKTQLQHSNRPLRLRDRFSDKNQGSDFCSPSKQTVGRTRMHARISSCA